MSVVKLTVASAKVSGETSRSTANCVALGAGPGANPGKIVANGPCRELATGFVMDVPLCWVHRTMVLAGRPVKFQAWAHEEFEGLKPVGGKK